MEFHDRNNELLLYQIIENVQNKQPTKKISAREFLIKYNSEKQIDKKYRKPYYFFSLNAKLDKPYYISRVLGIKIRNLTMNEIDSMLKNKISEYTPYMDPYPYMFEELQKKHLNTFIQNENIEIIEYSSYEEKLLCEKLLYAMQIVVIEVEDIDKIVELIDSYNRFIGEEVYDDYSDEMDKYIKADEFIYGCISLITIFCDMTSLGKIPFSFFELSEPYFNKTLYEYVDLLSVSMPYYLKYLEKDTIIDRFLNKADSNLHYTFVYMAYTLIVASETKNNMLEAIRSYITVLQALVVKEGKSVTKQFIENIKYCLKEEKQIQTQEDIDFVSKELVYIYDLRSREEHGNFDEIKNTYEKIYKLYKSSNYSIFRKEQTNISNYSLLCIIYNRLNYFLQIVCKYYLQEQNKWGISEVAKTKNMNIKVDANLKEESEKILKTLGITMQEAITLFLEEVKLSQGNSLADIRIKIRKANEK